MRSGRLLERMEQIREEISEISEGRSGPMTGWVTLDEEET